ncbi:MAG: arsenate reductase ArsC [Pseudomonadota bacterium]
MLEKTHNVLFLCTHNSARSVLSESILNHMGLPRFKGFSAGSTPRGTINPLALEILKKHGHDLTNLSSKSWDEFAGPDAPPIHFVFTLCDDAAGETCPYWPGAPIKDHWGMSDPSRVPGGENAKRAAFAASYDLLTDHMRRFVEIVSETPASSLAPRIKELSSAFRDTCRTVLKPHVGA